MNEALVKLNKIEGMIKEMIKDNKKLIKKYDKLST